MRDETMLELNLAYWNKLASQTIFISALLGGFSLTVLVMLLSQKSLDRLRMNLFKVAATAAGSFLVCIFAMTKILMMTTPGYPFQVAMGALAFPRILGMLSFFGGIVSVLSIIALAGWTKSKAMGRFTTAVGLVALILIMLMMT